MNNIVKLNKLVFVSVLISVFLSGCNPTVNQKAPESVSYSSEQKASEALAADNNISSVTSDYAFKNITCRVLLSRASDNWLGSQIEHLNKNSKFQTYSIDYPIDWISIYDKYPSSSTNGEENGHRVFHVNETPVAEIEPLFYIPEGKAIPDDYFKLAYSDEEGENPSYPEKFGDLKVGNLTGAAAKEAGSYIDEDDNSTKNCEFYVYYLTDGKTVINLLFYVNDDTKDFINADIMEKVVKSVKFLG